MSVCTKQSYLFYIGLIIKVLLGSYLASTFLTNFFIPFVDYFVQNGFQNPYHYFSSLGKNAYFPYPALMLYIISLPKLLVAWFLPVGDSHARLFLYRLPLLFADISIFLILKDWLSAQYEKRLIVLYWLSPVLIYITYIHGQLDVIPIAFLFASLYNLFNKRLYLSSLLLGLALSTKTNIAIVYPFFCFFLIAQNVCARDILIFLILSISVFLVLNLPYLLDEGFIQMVFHNQEQSKIFNASLALNRIKFYCVPAFFIFTFIQGGLLQHYNKNIFIMFLGFLFSIILLFIPPMPGWYFWLIPFLAYFYSIERGRSWFLFLGLQIAYLIYFAISKNSDYLSVFQPIFPDIAAHDNLYKLLANAQMDSTFFVNIAFTLLQSLLCINCVWLYRRGLNQYCKYKIISHPFLLGIGGDSGAGKSFISNCLANIFTPEKTCLIRGDDRHKWTRGHEKWQEQTHLNPKSNALHEEIYFLKKLKQGKIQYRKHYDHSTGQFTSAQPVIANHLLLYEGLHPFYISAQCSLYDTKVFIKPEKDLLCHWKLIRDIKDRCHTKASILKSIRSRETDMKKYIQTQIDKADILIEPLLLSPIQNIGDPNELLRVFYKVLLSNAVYIEPLLEALNSIESLTINHQYLENDVQLVILKGDCSALELQMLAQTYIPGLEELGVIQSDWPKGILGVLLLLLVHYIFEKAAYERE